MKPCFLLVFVVIVSGCIVFGPDVPEEEPLIRTNSENSPNGNQANDAHANGGQPEISVEAVAENLDIPWSIGFLPSGAMIFTERPGRVKVLENGFVHEISGVAHTGEGGLQGIAVDPEFENNNYIYLYYTYQDNGLFNRVSRFELGESSLENEEVLLGNIPGNVFHDGGRIKFGPDGKLYATTGDAGNTSLSQDLDSVAGKILRMEKDGSIPENNPFRDSYVYSYGHRNSQGLDWHPETGMLVVTEHGQTMHDEVNVIEAGKNYGWPNKWCKQGNPNEGFTEAAICFDSFTMAPSGAAFYSGGRLPFTNALIYAGLRGEQIRVARFSNGTAESDEKLLDGYGRIRDVVQGPDGWIYFATNNTDGRGTPRQNDDRIYRIRAS